MLTAGRHFFVLAAALGLAAFVAPARVVAAGPALPSAFVNDLMRDPEYASCARELNRSPATFARTNLRVTPLVLKTGEHMLTVTMLDAACICAGSTCKYAIYQRMPNATWRQVLDARTMNAAVALPDGTARVDGHETMSTIDQLVYVWDGSMFDFAPERSERFDTRFGQKPYRTLLRFPSGASNLTHASAAYGSFGDAYAFAARAGQEVMLRVRSTAKLFPIELFYGPGDSSTLKLAHDGSTRLPITGTYEFSVDPSVPGERAAYRLTLSIR
jgi:hypothetical protein